MLPWRETLKEWGAVFLDAGLFEGCVREVMHRASLACGRIEAGYPGTNAVFIVDGAYVVKIACPLFLEGLLVEGSVLSRLSGSLFPRLIARGEYDDGAHLWPYFIMEYKPGKALRDAYGALTRRQLTDVTESLAHIMRGIAGLKDIAHMPPFEERAARNIELNTMRLLDAGVPQNAVDAWTQRDARWHEDTYVLVHGDLTEDHLLIENGALTGVIDFADAAIAPPAYELPALYFGALKMDTELLRLFMDASGLRKHDGFYEEQAALLMRHDCGAGILLDAFERRGMPTGELLGLNDIKALYA